MSTPTDEAQPLPEDFAACDEHEEVYPIGGSCPECDTEQARELAKRWAWWHAFDSVDHDQAKTQEDLDAWLASVGPAPRVVSAVDRERLYAWVRMVADAIPDEVTESCASIIGANLDLDDEQAATLLSAADFPS